MSLFDGIKKAFQASDAENMATQHKMAILFMQSLNTDQLNGYQLVYGKHIKYGPNTDAGRHTIYNYVVGFRPHPVNIDLVLVPVDAALSSYGAPILINTKTFKKAGKTFLRRLYKFKTIYGNTFFFEVPPVNGKAAKMFGSEEIVINQEAAALEFKDFFRNLQRLS